MNCHVVSLASSYARFVVAAGEHRDVKLVRAWDLYILSVMAVVLIVRWSHSPALRRVSARLIGLAAYLGTPGMRDAATRNVTAAFEPHVDARTAARIVRESYTSTWENTLALCGISAEWDAVRRVRIEGLDRLERALDAGNGVILWESMYFGRRLLAKMALADRGFALDQLHAENHLEGFAYNQWQATRVFKAVIHPFFSRSEKQFLREIVLLPRSGSSVSALRTLTARVKANGIVFSAADGRMGQQFVQVDFFGRQRAFATGMVNLARSTGATLLPLFCFRDERGALHLVIENPIEVAPERDAMDDALRRYAGLLESYLRRYPEQYRAWDLLGSFEASPASLNPT
jgi:lauroyl/myristoyl acyltransferase